MGTGSDKTKTARAAARCPMCGRPPDEKYRPFCSKRCADIDLSRWLSGGYVIAGNAPGDEDEDGLPVTLPPPANDDE